MKLGTEATLAQLNNNLRKKAEKLQDQFSTWNYPISYHDQTILDHIFTQSVQNLAAYQAKRKFLVDLKQTPNNDAMNQLRKFYL